jgi:hypothetical protein
MEDFKGIKRYFQSKQPTQTEEGRPPVPVPRLPNEMWTYIIGFLDFTELTQCLYVSRVFYEITTKFLYEVPGFLEKVEIKDIDHLPIVTLKTTQIEGSLRRIGSIPTLKNLIVDTTQNDTLLAPRVIHQNQHINFYITVKHFTEPPIKFRDPRVFNNSNVYILTTHHSMVHPCQLLFLQEFHFKYIALSQIYKSNTTVNNILKLLQKVQTNRIILDCCPIQEPIYLDSIRNIKEKVVYLSSCMFWCDKIFPLNFCEELTNLEILDVSRGTVFRLQDFKKFSYSTINVADSFFNYLEEHLPKDRVNDLFFPVDKELIKVKHAFRIYVKKPKTDFTTTLEQFFVHRGKGRGGEYVYFSRRAIWGRKERLLYRTPDPTWL